MPPINETQGLSRRGQRDRAVTIALLRAAAFRARLVEEKKARAAETAAILATLLAVLPEDAKPANQGVAEVVAAVAELVGELQAQVEEHEGCEERQQKLEAELEEEVATGERHAGREAFSGGDEEDME